MNVDVPALLAQAQVVEAPVLRAWLDQLNDAYHNAEALVSDDDYDQLERVYTLRFGPYLQVGAAPRDNMIPLPFPLYSLDKIKLQGDEDHTHEGERALATYETSYPGPHVIEDKIDGLTGLYYQGRLYTRGNGSQGMDVSHFIDILRLPPAGDRAIRGEIVMPKAEFQAYKLAHPEASNPRNTTSGLVGSKTVDLVAARSLKYYAYQILTDQTSPEEQILTLRELGFDTPWVAGAPQLNLEQLKGILAWRKQEAPYEVDGLVISQNIYVEAPLTRNPRHTIAFKTMTPSAIRRVLDVEWVPSKDRLLKPTVRYEPFEFEGTILQHASGFNARYIVDNGIGPGALIRVTKGGEIIPDILEVIQPAEPLYPDFPEEDYAWDRNEVEFVLKFDTEEVIAKRIEYFMTKLDIKDVGPARAKSLVEQGFDTFLRILTASPQDFERLDRVGPKTAQKMWEHLHQGITNVPLRKLMAASGIMGRGFGERRSNMLLQAYPDILERARVLSAAELAELVRGVEGFGEVFSLQAAARLPQFNAWLEAHPMITVAAPGAEPLPAVIPADLAVVTATLTGRTVYVTGFRGDPMFKANIAARGGEYAETAPTKRTSATAILVAAPGAGKNKVEAAMKFGIPVMAREEFEALYFV